MPTYVRSDARLWARERLHGCCGCVQPTFTSDLAGLNEAAIRHDVAFERELDMRAVLFVAESGTTVSEYREFLAIGCEEAGEDLVTVMQASQPTLAGMIETIRYAADLGVDLVLPSYPLTFHPASLDDVFSFTKAVTDSTDLGVVLFAMDHWNFSRLHPAGFPVELLRRIVDECDNVVAIKNEIGGPGVGGIAEVFEEFNDEVVVTDPMESNSPAWVRNYGMQFMGTSNYECMAGVVPEYFELLRTEATFTKGMELYWKMAPVRRANAAIAGSIAHATQLVPRLIWKYQGWLLGFNGGPIRQPHIRITDAQMTALRGAARSAGLDVTGDDDAEFFLGRHPR
jgi:dihydrodipicolinate synthase/N-acetylneuraminate lyase